MTDETIDYAVIGLGKMGLLHMSILNSFSGTRLAAVCDKSFVIRRFSKNLFEEAEVVKNLEELSELKINAVYVTTPIPTHYSTLKRVFDENIADHVFVEKTLASSLSEAEELARLAQSSSGVDMVGYQKRFAGAFEKAKDLLSSGSLGELESFRAHAYSSDFPEGGSPESGARGGVLRDLGAHAVDMALWFFGGFEVESSAVEPSVPRADSASFDVSGSEGLSGSFEVSWSEPGFRMPEVGFSIRGSEGELRVRDGVVELESGSGTRTWRRPDLWKPPGYLVGGPEYSREDGHFLEAVRDGGEPLTSFRRALEIDRIIEDVEDSARDG